MNAAVAEVTRMIVEDRIARIESDVAELKVDVKTLGREIGSVRADLQDFKTDVAKEFGSVRAELRDFKTEVAKEFGAVRAELRGSVESLRTSIERSKVWMLGTGISTVLGVAAIVGFKLH